MERRWKVASIGGIPIFVTVPWLLFAALVIWGTYEALANSTALSTQQALWWSLFNAVLFYGSIVIHELAHAWSARGFDLPVHGITLVFWGGYTETHSGERGPLASFLISAAGPASTLALAGVFWVAAQATGGATGGVLSALLANLAFLSLIFAGLNALPGFPVDGGRMLLAVVWGITGDRFTGLKVAGWGGVVVGAAMGAWAIQLLQDGSGNWIFFGFVGWMMVGQGLQVTKQAPVLRELATGRVADAMGPRPEPIPAHATLLHALETHLRDDRVTEFPVIDADERLIGSLSFATAARVGANDPTRGVLDAMTPRERVRAVAPDQPLDRALEWIAGHGQALVVDGDRVVGRLTARDVDRWFAHRRQPTEPGGAVPPRPDLPGRGVGLGG